MNFSLTVQRRIFGGIFKIFRLLSKHQDFLTTILKDCFFCYIYLNSVSLCHNILYRLPYFVLCICFLRGRISDELPHPSGLYNAIHPNETVVLKCSHHKKEMVIMWPDECYSSNYFALYKCITSTHFTPYPYTRLYVNYISIKLGKWFLNTVQSAGQIVTKQRKI